MERKKKKLDRDDLSAAKMDFQTEELEQLFAKKFTYPRQASWTVKGTSLFQESATDHHLTCEPQHPCKVSRKQRPYKDEKCGCGSARETFASDHDELTVVLGKEPTGHERLEVADDNSNRHGRFILPDSWQCDVLMQMKQELNLLKDQLSDKEMVAWHKHTSATNPAGKVVGEMKRRYHAELCTQAWCKFHEILAGCDLLPPSLWDPMPTDLRSVHLCEAPGAFITSLNHFLASRGYRGKWWWLGTTLNPYFEGNDTGQMIDDDRFIRTTYSNWFFGQDNSGDLMSLENLELLHDQVKVTGGRVHLVTADGSIDCQENPAEQEILVSRLHHSEVLTACLLLAPGGALVIKLFTMFEASSITLMYFLNCVFSKVTVCKPATSKSGNSEVYVVCTGYTAPLPDGTLLSIFAAVISSDDPDIVLLKRWEIPSDFLERHIQCCRYFCALQSQTISGNIALYERVGEEEKRRLSGRQDLCVDYYVRLCCLQQISNQSRIVPFGCKTTYSRFSWVRSQFNKGNTQRKKTTETFTAKSSDSSGGTWMLPPGRFQGTFRQRQQQHALTWSQLLALIPDYQVDDNGCRSIQSRWPLREDEFSEWRPLTGRPLQSVCSSQFCDARLLSNMKQLQHQSQLRYHQEQALPEYAASVLSEASSLLLGGHFCCQHPSSSPLSEVFHLALEGSATLSHHPGVSQLSASATQLQQLDGLAQLEDRQWPVGVLVDVTCPERLEREETWCQRRLVDVLLAVCSYLPEGSSVVMLAPVSLTRLSAGLMYIMAGLFTETSVGCRCDSVFLHELYFFQRLQVPSYSLLSWLEAFRHTLSSCANTMLAPQAPKSAKGEGNGSSTIYSDSASPGVNASLAIDSRRPVVIESPFSEVDSYDENLSPTGQERMLVACGENRAGGVDSCDTVRFSQRIHGFLCNKSMSLDASGRNSDLAHAVNCSCHTALSADGSTFGRIIESSGDLVTGHTYEDSGTFANGQLCFGGCDIGGNSSVQMSGDSTGQNKSLVLGACTGMQVDIYQSKAGCFETEATKFPVPKKSDNSEENLNAVLLGKFAKESAAIRTQEKEGQSLAEGSGFASGDGAVDSFDHHARRSGSMQRKAVPTAPLELVPILQILNDTTFTRFLQASNRNCVGSFVNAIKAAELALLRSSDHQN